MIPISNLNDGKPEWNINETHIIIPMINGTVNKNDKESDKILTNALTFNSLENGDNTVLSSALEHSFIIGFDKNLFDAPNYKSDLVIIQNSDLRLLSCNNDLKTPVAYTLSYVDQNKSEAVWQNSVSKDRTGLNDKAVLEVRDVLNYNETVHEFEKIKPQTNLSSINSDIALQAANTNNGSFTGESVAEVADGKKSGYLVEESNDESTTFLQHLAGSNPIEDIKLGNNEKLFESKSQVNFSNVVEEDPQSVTEGVMKCNESMPVHLGDCKKFKVLEKNKTTFNKYKAAKNGKVISLGVSDSLLEKSLPLKKKAKMKRTLMSSSFENQRHLFMQDETPDQQTKVKSLGRKTKHDLTITKTHEKQNQHKIHSELSINKTIKQAIVTTKTKKCKKKFCESLIQGVNSESNNTAIQEGGETDSAKDNRWDGNKFQNIYDLVEYLRKSCLISSTLMEILKSGLKEINMDILKEMNLKKNKNIFAKSCNYSPQLKAFALVIYFKQPAAFNYLSQMFKVGWPSLKVIKEWKRQINGYKKANIVNVRANPEHCNL